MTSPGGERTVALDGLPVDCELVGGERTCLVGTQDRDTRRFLDSRDVGDDSLVLGQLLGTDGELDGQDRGHGDGNRVVVETATVRVVEGWVRDDNLEDDEQTDRDQAERSNLGESFASDWRCRRPGRRARRNDRRKCRHRWR